MVPKYSHVKKECITHSKTCLKWPVKNGPNKGLKEGGSLMQIESIAECSTGKQTLKTSLEWPFKTGFTVLSIDLY